MKILAIRLSNLASLSGEQCVDFTAEPLASAGLMAITGPTGSGKSTLLDALCLALFANTPRIQEHPQSYKVENGTDSLSGADERALLRRGCAGGYAEVDFLGVDDRRYRARWEVRRARDKANGRLQASQQTLLDLETQTQLGRTKTECQELIKQKLGLNMTQFTRAVLLAQSEFNAFLKATDDERGQLLEKLTDSKIYSQLGKRAYQNTKAAEAEVQKLSQLLEGFCPLPPEERQALELSQQQLQHTRQQQQQQLLELQHQQHRWHEHQRLTQQYQAASQACLEAEQQHQTLEPLRQQLEHYEQLKQLHPILKQLQHLADDIAQLNAQLPTQHQRRHEAQAALLQTSENQHSALNTLQQAQTRYQEAQPTLQQAEQHEHQLLLIQQQIQHLSSQKAKLEHLLSEQRQQLQQQEREYQKYQDQQEQLSHALQAEAHLAPLSQHWSYQRPQLHQLAEHIQERARHSTEQAVLEQALIQAQQQLKQLHLEHQQLEEEAGIPLHHLATQLDESHQRHYQALQQRQQYQIRHELQQEHSTLLQQHEQLQRVLPELKEQHHEWAEAHSQATQHLDILQQLLEQQKLARSQSAESLRAQLKPDSPCPVCGSLEHPWRTTEQLLANLAQQDDDSLNQAKQHVREQEAKLQAAQAELNQALESEKQQTQRLQTVEERILKLELPENIASDSTEDLRQANQTLEALEQQIQRLRGIQQRYQTLCNQQQQLQTTEQQAASHREQHAARAQQLDLLIQTTWSHLSPCLSTEQEQLWSENPQRAFMGLEERIQKYQQHEQRFQQALSQCQQLEHSLQHHRQQHAQTEEQLKPIAQDLLQAEQQEAQQRHDCCVLLAEHADSKQWRNALRAAIEAAQQQQQQALHHLHQQQRHADQAQHDLHTLQQRLSQLQQTEHALLEQKQRWQVQHPDCSEALIEQVSHFTAEDIQQWKAQTQAAEQAYIRCQAQQTACQQQLQQHAAQEPLIDIQALEQQRAALEQQQAETEQTFIQVASQIEEDKRCQVQAGELVHQLEAARHNHRRQAQISDLIGSADGAAFRKLAQAYNLDLLLQYANVQLRQLSRRYRLQRGGSALGLWIIDTDMGDECRSVHSLSGGESFLVSLALALGLAAMASQTLAIESLFIDEGFGSLDPDTLQTALDTLDSLQAQGRKVVVISHMPALHERIGIQIQVTPQGNGQSQLCINTP